MDKFLTFVTNHWQLWLAFVLVLLAYIFMEIKDRFHGPKRIMPQQAIDIVNKQGGKFIDIRDNNTYKQGYIIDSLNVPFKTLHSEIKKLSSRKEKPVIVVCAMGKSAVLAGVMLEKEGFKQVYVLEGGMNAWKEANLPIAK